jgi:hypothetical protein
MLPLTRKDGRVRGRRARPDEAQMVSVMVIGKVPVNMVPLVPRSITKGSPCTTIYYRILCKGLMRCNADLSVLPKCCVFTCMRQEMTSLNCTSMDLS